MENASIAQLMGHEVEEDHMQTEPIGIMYSRQWYFCAVRDFKEADFEFRASIHACQTFAILTLCNMHFDESEREWLIMGVAIQTARALKMHRLGTEASFDETVLEKPEWATVRGRQLGRRLWWTLVICDW